ncbi:MAG: tetratricopeptide repeat protein [Bacteroidales bacterium]
MSRKFLSYSSLIILGFVLLSGKGISQTEQNMAYIQDSISMSSCLDSIEKYINFNNKPKAYEFTLKGLSQFDSTTYIKGRIKLLQRAAILNCLYGMSLDSSVFYLNKMRTLSMQIGYKKGLLWYEHTFGQVYIVQKDYEKAYEFFNSAYQLAVEQNDSVAIADILPSIVSIQIYRQKYDSAIVNIRKALNIAQYYPMERTKIMLYDRLGTIYKERNDLDSALFSYGKAFEIANKIQSKLGVLTAQFNIAHIKYLLDSNNDIEPEISQLLVEMKKEGLYSVYVAGSYMLSDILEEQGKYDKALTLYKQTQLFEDSLIGNESVRKVVERESAFYLNLKEYENQQLIKDAEMQELKLRNRKIVIFFTLFILVASLLLLLNIFKKYKVIQQNIKTIKAKERIIFEQEKAIIEKEKEKIAQKVEAQQKENTSKLMRIYHYQEMARTVTNELHLLKRKLFGGSKNDNKITTTIQNIINQINSSDQDQLWNEFETSFNETNPEYLNRLSERYPDLTPNELKLCIFLNLNLRTKEISVITQQSLKSIEVARTRLRKKLGIDNTSTNISNFLRQV